MLRDEMREAIREGIQEGLAGALAQKERKTSAGEKILAFLNSNFGVFLLSAVIAGVSFGTAKYSAKLAKESENDQRVARVSVEIVYRVSGQKLLSEEDSPSFSAEARASKENVEPWDIIVASRLLDSEHDGLLPEFKDHSFHALFAEALPYLNSEEQQYAVRTGFDSLILAKKFASRYRGVRKEMKERGIETDEILSPWRKLLSESVTMLLTNSSKLWKERRTLKIDEIRTMRDAYEAAKKSDQEFFKKSGGITMMDTRP